MRGPSKHCPTDDDPGVSSSSEGVWEVEETLHLTRDITGIEIGSKISLVSGQE